MYVDGAVVGTRPFGQGKISTTADAFYLRYPLLYGIDKELPFRCMMDDVRVYNRALSADDLLQHYKKDRNWRKGRQVVPGALSVTTRVYAKLSKLRVEVDAAGLQPVPEGATLAVELLGPIGG